MFYERALEIDDRRIVRQARETSIRIAFYERGKDYDAETAKKKGDDKKAIEMKKKQGTLATLDDKKSLMGLFGSNVRRKTNGK